MSTSELSAAELSECAISHPYERRAVVLLHQAGWTSGELAMCFGISESSVARLIETEVVQ